MLFNLNVFQFSAGNCREMAWCVTVNAPVRNVFGVLTDVYQLSKWGAQKVGDRHIRLSAQKHNSLFIIADEVKDKYIEWRCINTDGTLNYNISFELSNANGHTILNFSKKYWGGVNNDVPEIDWENLLLILKTECEKQAAKPVLKIASIF